MNCPRGIRINENVEIKEVKNEKGTMRITKITIPRRLVQDAVGDAPKRIVKSTRRLSESSSSAGNESQEHRVVENRSISRRFNSSQDASSEKLSKRSSSSSKGISPRQSAKDLVITSHSQPTIVPPKRKHNTAASKSLLMRPHARE